MYFTFTFGSDTEEGCTAAENNMVFKIKNKSNCTSYITETYPCNVYPIEPHFYIAKLGFAGVHLFFLVLLQNIDCGYSLEPPRQGHTLCFEQR